MRSTPTARCASNSSGVEPHQPAGFLASHAWQVLGKEARWDSNTTFFAPNPGVLYPAVHDLAERALAAAKSVRSFGQSEQRGWRCSLTGETEWLTTDAGQLAIPPGQRKDTLWTRVAKEHPAWARKGEHLGALPAIKRLWPTLFAEEVGRATGDDGSSARRFVVSTHTMALASQIDRWLESGGPSVPGLRDALAKHADQGVALPRKLCRRHYANPALADARVLPALLDAAGDQEDEARAAELRRLVTHTLGQGTGTRLETYYSLLLMDGDHMGAWLAGGDDYAISYRDSFHPQVHAGFDFSLVVVPHVVEVEHLGRLIYAGGDDVLAMLPVAELLPAMQRLRLAYSGHDPEHEDGDRSGLVFKNGFARLGGRRPRLMRMMGHRATASCGAVVAHHQAPLGAVMRELRSAEQRAKNEGGRDAFSLTIVKRSGGSLTITAKWGEPAKLLHDLRRFLADDGVSRRAVYNTLDWLKDLPQDNEDMLRSLLAYQLARQADKSAGEEHKVDELARRIARVAFDDGLRRAPRRDEKRLDWLAHFMSAAEFLARETRGAD